MPRHPHEIAPRDDKDELLVAIYDLLVEIRDRLAPLPDQGAEPASADDPVTEAEASEAGRVLEQHQQETAAKPAAKKPARKKPAAKKKPA